MCVGADAGVDGTQSAGRVEGPGMPLGQHSERPGNACSVPASGYLVLEKKERQVIVVMFSFRTGHPGCRHVQGAGHMQCGTGEP